MKNTKKSHCDTRRSPVNISTGDIGLLSFVDKLLYTVLISSLAQTSIDPVKTRRTKTILFGRGTSSVKAGLQFISATK